MSSQRHNPNPPEPSDSESEADSFGFDDEDVAEAPEPAFDGNVSSDEEELERLVLGARASFREQLFRDDFQDDIEEVAQGASQIAHGQGTGLEDVDSSALFMFDAAPSSANKQLVSKPAAVNVQTEDVAAWEDSDDERLTVSLATANRLRKLRISEGEDLVSGTEYSRRLRQQYLRLYPLPEWAKKAKEPPSKRRRRSSAASGDSLSDSDVSGDEDDVEAALPLDKFLRDVNSFNSNDARKRRKLRPEVIDIQRTRDIPDTHKAAVGSLSFHPQYPVLMSSSTSSIIYLHHLDATAYPTPNPLLTSVQVKNTAVRRSAFLEPKGDQIVFAGRRRYFHTWDVSSGTVKKISKIQGHQEEQKTMERFRLSPCGRYIALIATDRKGGGMLNIVNVKTMQWIAQARIDSRGGIADFAWWKTGDGLTILGKDGQLAEYSMLTRRTTGLWRDEGSIGGTVVSLGGQGGPVPLGGDRWVAVGSNSGIVNIYDRNGLVAKSSSEGLDINGLPEPARTFEQLTTPITMISFTPDGQLLAFASQHKKDALRLVHVETQTVYRNWPTAQTPLGRITAVAFGRESDLLAVGNDNGKVRLWEIRSS